MMRAKVRSTSLLVFCVLLAGCLPPSGVPVFLSTRARVTRLPPTLVHQQQAPPKSNSTQATPNSITETPTETPNPWVYVFPVQPPGVADFGDDANSHGFPATDIFAPEGTSFVAVTGGVVDFVSYEDRWDPKTDDLALRGGLCVAIIGDDGLRYYGSHLSAIEPRINIGVRVEAGQTLGYIGSTGNARNRPPHLHFGISRPTYSEDWFIRRGEINPFPYLIAWLQGRNLTPLLLEP